MKRYRSERLLTAGGLMWACYDGARVVAVFSGPAGETRARAYAEMLEASCP